MEYVDDIELQLCVKIKNYSPPRPAPICRNPSDPAYGDMGDDEELDFILYIKHGKNMYEVDEYMYDDKRIVEAVFKIARDTFHDAVMDKQYEAIR